MPELGISEKARKYKFTYWKERLFFCQFKNKEGFENTVRGFKFEVLGSKNTDCFEPRTLDREHL